MLYAMASAWRNTGRPDKAESAYRDCLRLDDTQLPAMNDLAILLSERGRGREAIALGEKLLERTKNAAYALDTLGFALYSAGEYKKAKELLFRALEKEPQQVDILLHYALACKALGEAEEAESHFRKAFRLLAGRPEMQKELKAIYEGGRE